MTWFLLRTNLFCQEHLQSLRRRLKNVQRQARRQRQDVELCGLTPRGQLVCLSIYILSGFQANVAAAFLLEARQSRKRSLEPEIQEAKATDNISLWFRETSFEKLCDLQDGKDSAIHAEASKFVSKWRTAEWVAQQNYECGLAPTYDRLARKYCAELEACNIGYLAQPLLASAEGSDGRNGCAGRTARAWCGRFCRQFAFARKRLVLGGDMPLTELEEKVF